MIDFAIDNSTGDMTISSAAFSIVSGAAEVVQRIKIHLARCLGEWFLNTVLGLPWYQGLLGSKDSRSIDLALRREIQSIYGVRNIKKLNIAQNSREVSAYIEVYTIYATIETINISEG